MKTTKRIILILSMLALLVGCFAFSASAAENTETLSIAGSTGTTGTKTISWTSGVITVTNNQASSTTAIRTSDSDHYRVYKGSEFIIATTDEYAITKIVITATSSSYATACANSLSQSGYTASTSSTTVTITGSGSSSVSFPSATAQYRIKTLVVTYEPAGSEDLEATADEKVEYACNNLNVSTSVTQNGTINLPTADSKYEDVSIAWELTDNGGVASLDGNSLTITLGNAATTVKLTATISCEGAENLTKDFTISVPKADPTPGSTLTISEAIELGTSKDTGTYTAGKYYVTGVITEVYNTTYGNMYITDGENTLTVYGTYDADGTNRYDAMATQPVAGDTVTLYGVVGNYGGTPQMQYAWITEHTVPDLPEFEAIFNVAKGTVENITGARIELPAANDFGSYKFVGWSNEPVIGTQDKPELYEAGASLTLEANAEFYAVYSYTYTYVTESDAEPSWQLVNDASSLKAGDKIVIVASDYDYALSTNQKSNNRGQASVVKSGNTVTFGDDVQILTLEAGTVNGTFAFYTGSDGYLYAASSSSNYLRTQATNDANGSWVITIADGVATVVAQGTNTKNTIQYNQTSSLFACYASASQKAISIYKLVGGSTETSVTTYTSAGFSGAQVNLGQNLSVKYQIFSSYKYDQSELQVRFTIGDRVVTVSAVDGLFVLDNIAPNAMDVNIKAELLCGDTVLYTKEDYSIKSNLENLLENAEEGSALANICNATLAYGEAAKAYKENAEGTVADDALVADEDDVFTLEGNLFIGVSVFFGDVNKIRVKYTVADGYTVTLNGNAVENANGVIETDGIYADKLGDAYTFVITNGEDTHTLTYNVYAYCTAASASSNANMANLAIALNNYGIAASAYAAQQ